MLFCIILFQFFSFSNSFGQSDCRKFKKGRFYYEGDNNRAYLIRRSGRKQIEWDLSVGTKITTDLLWLGDCNYQLIYSMEESGEDTISALQKIPVFIEIKKTDESGYDFVISGFDDLIQFNGRMTKINRKKLRRLLKGVRE